MQFNELPFNSDDMVAGLRPWIECESPTHDAAAVDRMIDLASYDLAASGATVERIPGRLGFGGSVRATFPHPDQGKPGILIAGHMDTVHPLGTLDVLPCKREGNQCRGPGIQDMKSGNYLSLEAIRQLRAASLQTPLPITVLFTPDEEVGTPSTRELIEATAAQNKYVLVPEPARPDGGVVWGRYAIARYYLETIGVPIHAGVDPRLGRSAIKEMARRIIQVEEMTTDDCTFSVGVIHGGEWVNCVASSCRAEALSMAKRQEDPNQTKPQHHTNSCRAVKKCYHIDSYVTWRQTSATEQSPLRHLAPSRCVCAAGRLFAVFHLPTLHFAHNVLKLDTLLTLPEG